MPVNEPHPLYKKYQKQWSLIRDCIEGEEAIKAKGELYLPRAKGYSKERYESFKLRAEWINYTRRTLNGLHGLIFRRSPVIELPDELEKKGIKKNIDRRGTSIYQFFSNCVISSMPVSFGGIMVDIPQNNVTNVLEAEQKGIKPYTRFYEAEKIINWKIDNVNGYEQLVMVVLEEEFDKPVINDPFAHDKKIRYRVLVIENDIYKQYVFTPVEKKEAKDGVFDIKEIPIEIDGKPINYIPFYFMPGKEPEAPMFLDLAKANIGNYRKSADYENGVHLTTIPTGWITGHEAYVDENGNKETVGLGEDAFLMIKEPDANVGTLCFSGTGLTHSEKALEMSMSNMAILASRLIAPEKGTSESADSAKIHRAGENATLATFAKNCSETFTKVLQTICDWYGIKGEVRVELCTDYDTLSFDANALNSLANLSSNGKLPLPYVFSNLVDGEYAPAGATLEEYATLLDMERAGYTPTEIVKAFRDMREGKKKVVIIKKRKPIQPTTSEKEEDKVEEKEN